MCGRFTLRTPTEVLLQTFGIEEAPEFPLRYNIAPTQDIVSVRAASEKRRELAYLHWGLVPFWAKDPSIGNRMINARAETVSEKPAYRQAFRKRRCLIVSDGYYEWQKQGRAKKQPFYIHRRDDRPFAFAGLWECWPGIDPPLESCVIITTNANSLSLPIHDRMPVILRPEDYDQWLDPTCENVEQLSALLTPYVGEEFQADPVSTFVNNARHEGPECIQPA